MRLPKHISLTITHQPYAGNYQTVEQWLDESGHDVAAADRAAMLETGEVWEIQWHPNTPIGFESVCAATLDRALELALELAESPMATGRHVDDSGWSPR